MDALLNDFNALKISALTKLQIINEAAEKSVLIEYRDRNRDRNDPPIVKKRCDKEPPEPNEVVTSPSLKINRALVDLERRRREEVNRSVELFVRKIESATKKAEDETRTRWYLNQKRLVELANEQEQAIARSLVEQKNVESDGHLRELQREHKKKTEELRRQHEAKELQRKLAAQKEGLNRQRQAFKVLCQETLSTIKNEKLRLTEDDVALLRSVHDEFEQAVNNADADGVATVARKLEDFKTRRVPELLRLQEEQKESQVIAQQKVQVENAHIEKNVGSAETLTMYSRLLDYQKQFEETYRTLAQSDDPAIKKFRFALQRAVNIPLNAISAASSAHLTDKYSRLSDLLKGETVSAGGETFAKANGHPEGIAFCMDLLARKAVQQGDLMVSSNGESAHAFAAVLISLWQEFPELGKLFLSHLYRTAPCLAPVYLPRSGAQTDRQFYEAVGYRYDSEGRIERQDMYLKRLSGYTRLYAAVIIARTKNRRAQHPHGLVHAWRYLSALLNLTPQPDITATLLLDFLDVCGHSMHLAYRSQFVKLMHYIKNEFLPAIKSVQGGGGPVTRLEVFLTKWAENGQLESPKGRLAEGFW